LIGALKLGALVEDRPVRMTLELPGPVHCDLVRYAAILSAQTGQTQVTPEKLVWPMLERFMATDRAFAKFRRQPLPGAPAGAPASASDAS